MYIAEKTLKFFLKVLLIIAIIILVIVIISKKSINLDFEKIFLNILERFVDFVRNLFVISHDASRKIINNFELP